MLALAEREEPPPLPPTLPTRTSLSWPRPERANVYLHARYYDPALGVFLRPDPALADVSAYGYSHGDPINLSDRSGLDPTPCTTTWNPKGNGGQGVWQITCPNYPSYAGWLMDAFPIVGGFENNVFEHLREKGEERARRREEYLQSRNETTPPAQPPNGGCDPNDPSCAPPPPGGHSQRPDADSSVMQAAEIVATAAPQMYFSQGNSTSSYGPCMQSFGARFLDNMTMSNRWVGSLMMGARGAATFAVGAEVFTRSFYGISSARALSLYLTGHAAAGAYLAGASGAGVALALEGFLLFEASLAIGSAAEAGRYRAWCSP